MKRVMKEGALSHLRVIDLSQVRSGPTCVKQFADFGADVIKVEAPDAVARQELYVGDRDGADMQNLHRNKRSITLDLKHPEGLEVLMRLVATADVVVENFRPDVKRRLGIDYASLAAVNGRIVLVSISGFGEEGQYRDKGGYDQILQGMCGLMSSTGFPDGMPTRAGAAVVDMASGLYAALGALTALAEREQSGRGQWVQTSLLRAGIALMDFQAARCSVDGEVPQRLGNDHPTSMPTSAYATLDGYINVGAGGEAQWRLFCEAIGMPELVGEPAFANNKARSTNRAALNLRLSERFREKSTAEWSILLDRAGVPCGPIYAMNEVLADPQVQATHVFETAPHPRRGDIALVGQAARLSRTPPRIASTLEDKGGSTDELLAELGYDAPAIAALRASAAV